MCGAEIDAARRGRSFDLRTSRALSLALAAAARDGGRLSQERGQAVMPGNKYLGLECLFLPSPVRRPFLVVDTDLAHYYHLW